MSEPMNIGFSPNELRRFEAQLDATVVKSTKKMQEIIERVGFAMTNTARHNAPMSGGTPVLKNSIRFMLSQNRLAVRVGTTVNYAPFVEFGTKSKVNIPPELLEYAAQFKGQKTGSFKNMLEAIELWCKRKGIPESAAYPIVMKILKEGVQARPFLYPAFKEGKKMLIEKLKQSFK